MMTQPLTATAPPMPRQHNVNTVLHQMMQIGDTNIDKVLAVLRDMCNHQNRDKTWYTPRIQKSVIDPPLQIVTLHDQALSHFTRKWLTEQRIVDALVERLHLRVWAWMPEECEELRARYGLPFGVTYVIGLVPIPALDQPRRLVASVESKEKFPKVATLDLGAIPARQLIMPFGVDGIGKMRTARLNEQGHGLFIGMTQYGKSSQVNVLLTALTQLNPPEMFRFALVTTKDTEAARWADCPHILCEPSITAADALRVLNAVTDEIAKRKAACAAALVSGIDGYNKLYPDQPMPHFVFVFDETLMVLDSRKTGRDATELLRNIVVGALQYGVHVWILSQHLATDGRGVPRDIATQLDMKLAWRIHDSTAARQAEVPAAATLPEGVKGRFYLRINGRPSFLQGFFFPDEFYAAQVRAWRDAKQHPEVIVPKVHVSNDERAVIEYVVAHPEKQSQRIQAWKARGRGKGAEGKLYVSQEDIEEWLEWHYQRARKASTALLLNGLTIKDRFNGNTPYLSELALNIVGGSVRDDAANPPILTIPPNPVPNLTNQAN